MPTEMVVAPGHDRERSLGWLAVAWMEHFCVYGPGDVEGRPFSEATARRIRLDGNDPGEPIPLSDELTLLTVDCYALRPDGRRLYDSAFYSRPKGADKSGQAARFGLFEFLGPCRFSGFAEGTKVFDWGCSKGEVHEWQDFRYQYRSGEPMGREMVYPFIRLLATEEGQTGNVYDSIYYNCHDGPLREMFATADDVGLTRVFHPVSGEIRPCTSKGASKDGGLETYVDFDETHLYITPELRRTYDTVRRNLTKRKAAEPWSFESSTMYQPGQDSIAERTHKEAKDIRDGHVRRPRTYFNHREGFPLTDLKDEQAVRATIVEAYGDASSYVDIERKMDELYDKRNDVQDTRRYTFNQPSAAYDAWLAKQEWDLCAAPDRVVAPGEQVTLGFDGSKSDDHSALMGCCVSDSHLFAINVWDPRDYKDEQIPMAQVDAAVRKAFIDYDVVAFYSDVHPFETYVDKWEEDLGAPGEPGEGLCQRVSPYHAIAWDMRGRKLDTTKMVESFHDAVLERQLTHSGDKRVDEHIYNARRRPNNFGVTFGKESPDSANKVDAAAAAALARKARQDYLALPESKKRQIVTPVWHGIYIPKGAE